MSDNPAPELAAAWRRHISFDTNLLDAVVRRYREKHRRYHNVAHLVAVVAHAEQLVTTESAAGAVLDAGAVIAAAAYHDAIYEPRSPANEQASGRLAHSDLATLGWPADRIDRVVTMIAGTTTHLDPPDLEASILFDADLAVLGASPASYAEYVAAVRAEYRHVPDDAWRSGRASVLRGFLERASIFATDTGRRRWEDTARKNLRAELDATAAIED